MVVVGTQQRAAAFCTLFLLKLCSQPASFDPNQVAYFMRRTNGHMVSHTHFHNGNSATTEILIARKRRSGATISQ